MKKLLITFTVLLLTIMSHSQTTSPAIHTLYMKLGTTYYTSATVCRGVDTDIFFSCQLHSYTLASQPTGCRGNWEMYARIQHSTDQATWTDLVNSGNDTYWQVQTTNVNEGINETISVNISQTTYYRVYIYLRNSACGLNPSERREFTTPVLTLTPSAAVATPVIGNDQTICEGETPDEISGSSFPASSGCSKHHYWQCSSNGGISWVDMTTGATGQNYQPGAITQDYLYRRRDFYKVTTLNQNCPSVASNQVSVTVNSGVTLWQPTATEDELCYGETTVLTASTSGSGTYSYQWQQAASSGSSWSNISGATSRTYTTSPFPTVSTLNNTLYRVVATQSGVECSGVSTHKAIYMHDEIIPGVLTGDEAINLGETPLQITGTDASSWRDYVYTWQKSEDDGNTWQEISGATGLNYQPPALTQYTRYRRIDKLEDMTSCSAITNEVAITIYADLISPVIDSDQTICINDIPEELTGTEASGGSGSYSYQWQQSTDNGVTWNDIVGATDLNYQPLALSQTTKYRLNTTSAGIQVTSEVVEITIDSYPQITTTVDKSLVCENATVELTATTNMITYNQYQWQKRRTTGSTWTDIIGANSVTAYDQDITTSSVYRLLAIKNNCQTESTSVTVNVMNPLLPGTIGNDQVIDINYVPNELIGSPADGAFYMTPSGSYLYQWEKSTSGGTWQEILGATGLNYQPSALSEATQYRRYAESEQGYGTCTGYSNIVSISTRSAPNAPVIGTNQTICYNSIPSRLELLEPVTVGTDDIEYQWRYRYVGETRYYNINSTGNYEYYQPSTETSTKLYSVIAWYEDSNGDLHQLESNEVTITVLSQVTVGDIYNPNPDNICPNLPLQSLELIEPTGGSGDYTYQWEKSIIGGTPQAIAGATELSYQPPLENRRVNYYVKVRDELCPENEYSSDGITLRDPYTIDEINSINQVRTSGLLMTCYNEYPSSSIIGIDLSSYIGINSYYQWQQSELLEDGTWGNWEDIESFAFPSNGQNYHPEALITTTRYRRNAWLEGCGDYIHTSYNYMPVEVKPELTVPIITGNQTICIGSIPERLQISEDLGNACGVEPAFQKWQMSTDNINWQDLNYAQFLSNPQDNGDEIVINQYDDYEYQPGVTTQKTYYRLRLGNNNYVYSNVVTVDIHPLINNSNRISPYLEYVCYNTQPNLLEYEEITGGSGSYLYQWERSNNGTTWNDIENANISDYQPPAITTSTYYRLKVSDNVCTNYTIATLASFRRNVMPEMLPGQISVNDNTSCYNTAPNEIIGTRASGTLYALEYQWQQSTDNVTWTNIIGATERDYQPSSLTESSLFRRTAYSDVCDETVISNQILIEVSEPLDLGSISESQTICFRTTPLLLESEQTPTGGFGNYQYEWYESSDNITWTRIRNAVYENYQPSALTSTNYYKRYVTSDPSCDGGISNIVEIAVIPELHAGTILEDQTIAYEDQPELLTGSSASGGSTGSPVTYQWQYSEDQVTWIDIEGATEVDFQPPVLRATTYYQRLAFRNGCEGSKSNIITITVFDRLYGGQVGDGDFICYNTAPAELIEYETPVGGAGSFIYQWYVSNNRTDWEEIPGANGATYQAAQLQQTTFYKRMVVAATSLDTAFSNVIQILVSDPVNAGSVAVLKDNTEIRYDDTLCYNRIMSDIINMEAASGGIGDKSYRWQFSEDNLEWYNMPAQSLHYSYTMPNTQSIFYRRVVTDSYCGTAASNVIPITVLPPVTNPNILQNQSICYDSQPNEITGIQPNGGIEQFIYQWQFSNDSIDWFNISGATDINYQPQTLRESKYYRRKADVAIYECDYKISNPVKITVYDQVTAPTIGSDQTICYNTVPEELTGSEPTGGNGVYSYQWSIYNNESDGWEAITGATTINYQPPALLETSLYMRKAISDGCHSNNHNTVEITVYNDIDAGTLLLTDDTICYNTTPVNYIFTDIYASGADRNYSYQWQQSFNNVSWSDISGATDINYRPTDTLLQETYYRRKVMSSCGDDYTPPVSIIVYEPLTAGIVGYNQTITIDQELDTLIEVESATGGNNDGYMYRWEILRDSVWSFAYGGNEINFLPINLSDTTYIRRVTSNGCGDAISNTIQLNILPEIYPGIISPETQTICYNTIPSEITGTEASGGSETFLHLWQRSENGEIWNNITNATGLNYQPPALTSAMYFRRLDILANIDTVVTNTVLIDIYADLEAGTIRSSQDQVCYNTEPGVIFTYIYPTGGDDSFATQWQQSSNGISWSDIDGATDIDYQPTALTQPTYYRKKVVSECSLGYTDTVLIDVVGGMYAGIIEPFDQLIGYNTTPEQINGETPITLSEYTYQWQFSVDSINWINYVVDATGQNYQPNNLNRTNYIRRLTRNMCLTDTSNTVVVNVLSQVRNNTINSSQTICYNSTPEVLEGSIPTGGTGDYDYQWERSENAEDWTNILNATGQNYQPSALTSTRYYRRKVSTGIYETTYSNIIEIDVYSDIVAPTLNADEIICYNTKPSISTLTSAASGGTGDYTYHWEQSQNGVEWNDIEGATNTYFISDSLTETVLYRIVTSDGCRLVNSEAREIEILAPLADNYIDEDQYHYINDIPEMLIGSTPTGGTGEYSYQWLRSENDSIWRNIINANEIDYQPTALDTTTLYKRVAINECAIDTSNSIRITIYPQIELRNISESQTVCYNTAPNQLTGVAATGGTGTFSYQWLRSTDLNDWTEILNATGLNYQPQALTEVTYYRLKATDAYSYALSNIVEIGIYSDIVAPTINEDETICFGTNPSGNNITSLPMGGSGNYNYNWQQSQNGGVTWSDIDTAYETYYFAPALTETTMYRLTVNDECGTRYSLARTINVLDQVTGSYIEEDQYHYINDIPEMLIGSTPSGGTGEYSYQWLRSEDDSVWNIILNANDRDYQPAALDTTTYYKRVAINECARDTSNTLTISIYPVFMAGELYESQLICYNTYPSTLMGSEPIGGSGDYTYQWEILVDTTWEAIPEGTDIDYQPQPLTTTTSYRRIDRSPNCESVVTNTTTVNVYEEIIRPTATFDEIYCKNETIRIQIENPTRTYEFYDSSYNYIQTGSSYTITGLTESNKYYVKAIDVYNCQSDYTQININVENTSIDFNVVIHQVEEGNPLQFTPSVNIDTIDYEYTWNFYDGDGSFETNSWHYYNKPGEYDVTLNVISENGCTETLTKTEIINVVSRENTGISDESEIISVYPNPFVDYIVVTGLQNPTTAQIQSTTGEILEIINIEDGSMIDMSRYSKGAYILHMTTLDKEYNLKLLK